MVKTESVLMARWKDANDLQWGCQGPNEFSYVDYPDFCLWYEDVEDTYNMAEGPYWKIQNSWGEGWGHHGFAYIEHVMPGEHDTFTEGTCQMFRWASEYVKTKYE